MLGHVALLSVGLLGLPTGADAQPVDLTLEQHVKAAFLYSFTAYVDWPASAFEGPDAPLVLAVIGDDALAVVLAAIVASRNIAGRSIVVRIVRGSDDLRGIHMLFVGRSEGGRVAALVRTTGNQPLLIVTESNGALDQGSIINFVVKDGRVKFDVALDTAGKRGLRLSSRLLTVAQHVRAVNLQ